jgi:orotate phosphoribosyltransferase
LRLILMVKLDELKGKLLPFIRAHAKLKLKEPIQLSSGKMSHEYFDGRRVTLHPEGMTLFARTALELISPKDFDAVGGPSIGADPIVTAISLLAYLEKGVTLPGFLIRKEQKEYGLQRRIEGTELKKGMKVLLVEDVLTTGNSALKAIQAVEEAGATVSHVLCLVDRNEGAQDLLKRYQLTALFTKDEIG